MRRIVVTSLLDVAQFALPSLLLGALITYTAWSWWMDIPVTS